MYDEAYADIVDISRFTNWRVNDECLRKAADQQRRVRSSAVYAWGPG